MNLVRILSILLIILISILFPFGFISYLGNKFYYVLFTILSSYAILFSFRKDSIFFETFFSILLWLGFWFKFTVQIAFMDSMFPEGFGYFDHKPESYDEVLLISSIAFFSFIIASYIRQFLLFTYYRLEQNLLINKNIVTNYKKNKRLLLSILVFTLVIISIINYKFSLFQKGTVPDIVLPFSLNSLFNWLLMFGFASFFSVIIYFEFLINNKNNKYLSLGFMENFISSISSISRAMIFNGSAILFGFYRLQELRLKKINNRLIIKNFIILFVLFAISLFIVSKIRQQNNFPVGHQVHSYIPTVENIDTSNIFKRNSTKVINEIVLEINHILFLIAGRWVGVDAMMAVQAIEDKNFNFFIKSFNEEFNFSNSFFENSIKGSFYEYPSKPKVYTVYVPGLIGFLYYSNSKLFIFFSIIFICLFCALIEKIAYKISKCNLIFSSLVGNVLAYRLAHFGYLPSNTYKILIAIAINLLLMYLICYLLSKNNKQ
tara:strand:- start:4808 stop:6274 length:1467 start_codon:yes stop_codon:yes gene_type:complete